MCGGNKRQKLAWNLLASRSRQKSTHPLAGTMKKEETGTERKCWEELIDSQAPKRIFVHIKSGFFEGCARQKVIANDAKERRNPQCHQTNLS